MTSLASGQVAGTPWSVLVPVLLGALLALCGFIGKRLLDRMTAQDKALATLAQAMAVQVERFDNTSRLAKDTGSKVSDLDRAVASLRERLSIHEQWSRDEYERAIERLTRLTDEISRIRNGGPPR